MTNDTPVDGFEWVVQPWGQVLRCSGLFAVADHFFTDRQLGLRGTSREPGTWELAASAIGVETVRLFRPKQVHGRSVAVVTRNRAPHPFSRGRRPEADAVISNDPSCALAVQVADCVPILIGDPRTGAVAAVHAGWRGTAAGVVRAALEALGAHYGSRPRDLVAALGPSIGPCCYHVGPELADAFLAAGHAASSVDRWFEREANGRRTLDLWTATRDQLREAGVPAARVHAVRLCTAHDTARFFSYRAEGSATGRMAAVVRARV